MSRATWGPLVLVLVLVALVVGGLHHRDAQREAERIAAAEAREEHTRAAHARELEAAQSESREALAGVLDGVALGDTISEVRAARPQGAVEPARAHADPGFRLYQEQLANGAQVIYAFDEGTDRLARVQMLSLLEGADGFGPHLAALTERYGTPTGIWDCTDDTGLSTRRFTWRREHVALADVMLIYGARISLTFYVTTNEQMARSLRRSGCSPTPRERLEQFPIMTPEQIQAAQESAQQQAEQRATP